MLSTTLRRLSISFVVCAGIILGIVSTASPAEAVIVCSPSCSEVCDPDSADDCFTTSCCNTDEVPCTEDEIDTITCLGSPKVVVSP